MRQEIQTHFPQDAILGEELEDLSGDSGYRWILDPIDGTKSYNFRQFGEIKYMKIAKMKLIVGKKCGTERKFPTGRG